LQNDTRRSVLHSLQLLNNAGWSSVQHSVAVVQPRQHQAARQCERHFGRQKMADVPDGLDVIVARPGHRCRVTIERQATVQHNSEDFISSATGRSTPATVMDDKDAVATCSWFVVPMVSASRLVRI